MKNIFFLAIIFLSIQTNYGQQISNQPNENSIYSTAGITVKPDFPGGIKEFHKFIAKNYITPQEAKEIKGKIYVTFIVEKDGSLTSIKVLRDLGFGTSEEAIRVLQLCPKWIPGQQKGQIVRTLFSLPISFNGF